MKTIKLNLKLIWTIIMVLIMITSKTSLSAQAGCDGTVPTYVVDLTGQPNGTYLSPPDVRVGNCCGTTSPDNCIQFIVTLDPASNGIVFSIASGAIPPGAIFYQVNCGPPAPVGDFLCLSGVGPHYVTFCKPGNNPNSYQITALPQPTSGPDAITSVGCSQPIYVNGLDPATTTWTSIFPGPSGTYNSYLNCTSGCDSVTVTPTAGAPAFVDYLVCGFVFGGCYPFTYCDTIRVNINPDLTSINTNVSCFGGSNGSVDMNSTGGPAPITYSWSNGATTEDISGLLAGGYTVTVTTGNGCTQTLNAMITEAPMLTNTISQNNITCFGFNNGSVDITPAGGTPGYSYSWSNGSTTEDISGLSSGNYTVTITDNNGCTTSSTGTITQPTVLSIVGSPTNILCNGANTGSIILTTSGGTPGYTFSWNNGSITENISGLAAGTYSVIATDANGCTTTYSATLSQPAAPLTVSGITTHVNCFGNNSGLIDVTVSGGTSPYTYSWNTGATTQDLASLVSGMFTLSVTDANGCVNNSFSTTVTQPVAALTVTGASNNILCFGNNNGTIDVTPSGGTLPYSYSWSNGASTQDLTGLSPGGFTLTLTDANGCTNNTYSTTITQPAAALSLSGTVTNVICFGDVTGSINVSISGGTPGYTYSWSNGSITEDLINISAATYLLTVTDANGCVNNSFIANVMQPSALIMGADSYNPNCTGTSTGSINLTPGGGTIPYAYAWSIGSDLQDISNLPAGGYSVTVTDANGCTITGAWALIDPLALIIVPLVQPTTCYGLYNGSIELNVIGGVGPYSSLWNTGANTIDLTNVGPGNYNVTVTDANGCTTSGNYVIPTTAPLNVNIDLDSLYLIWLGESTELSATASGGTGALTYGWSPPENLSCDNCQTTTASPLINTTYAITVTDANGCTATDVAFIEVLFAMYVPNTFTPNGDGDNDEFLAVSTSVKEFTMRIFDRWGEELIVINDINQGWNGSYKGNEAKQDIYIYKLEAKFLNGKYQELIGQVNLLR